MSETYFPYYFLKMFHYNDGPDDQCPLLMLRYEKEAKWALIATNINWKDNKIAHARNREVLENKPWKIGTTLTKQKYVPMPHELWHATTHIIRKISLYLY